MSYRKKRRTAKVEQPVPQAVFGKEYSNPGEERVISTARLTSGQPYQQQISEKKVENLVREWDDRLLTPLTVSFRDGKFNVVDGQHRIAAMRKMNNGENVMVPCLVYSGLTYEQEAELCYRIDQSKGRLSLAMSTNALMESGQDAQVLEIRRLLEQEGFTWALGKKAKAPYEIAATAAVIRAYRLLGGAVFSRMFSLLRNTWHGDPQSLQGTFLSGMALFLKTYELEVNDHHFSKRLTLASPEEISRRSRLDLSTSNAALRYARVIWDKYNSYQRGERKLPYRFKG